MDEKTRMTAIILAVTTIWFCGMLIPSPIQLNFTLSLLCATIALALGLWLLKFVYNIKTETVVTTQ